MIEARVFRGLAVIAAALAGAPEAWAQERIASVQRIEPQGTRQQRSGTAQALALGSGLFHNDIVETSPHGRLDVAFTDGTRLGVGPSSQVTLDSYVYRPGGSGASAVLGMAKGAMRFISGNVQRDGMRITTPTATIGIRGTDFVVTVTPAGATRVRVDQGSVMLWACGTARTAGNAYLAEAGYSITVDTSCIVSVMVLPLKSGPP